MEPCNRGSATSEFQEERPRTEGSAAKRNFDQFCDNNHQEQSSNANHSPNRARKLLPPDLSHGQDSGTRDIVERCEVGINDRESSENTISGRDDASQDDNSSDDDDDPSNYDLVDRDVNMDSTISNAEDVEEKRQFMSALREVVKSARNRPNGSGNFLARSSNINDKVLKHTNETFVTEHVNNIAGPLFGRKLETPSDSDPEGVADDFVVETYTHHEIQEYRNGLERARRAAFEVELVSQDKTIFFDLPPILNKSGVEYYRKVNIGNSSYRPGDYILVTPSNLNENSEPRYGRIISLCGIVSARPQANSDGFAHVRWFEAGIGTTIGELADPHEIFETSLCGRNQLCRIITKIHVDFCGKTAKADGLGPLNGIFTSASEPAEIETECCAACDLRRADDLHAVPQVSTGASGTIESLTIGEITYHLLDCVQVAPGTARGSRAKGNQFPLCKIGQIVEMTKGLRQSGRIGSRASIIIRIRLFGRYDELLPDLANEVEENAGSALTVRDSKRLFRRNNFELITEEQLDGKLIVAHRARIENMETFKDAQNLYLETFWSQDEVLDEERNDPDLTDLSPLSPEEILCSDKTLSEHRKMCERHAEYLENAPKLVGFDLFSGAGGFTIAFELSGSMIKSYAVDFSAAACENFKHNFPRSVVYNQDLSYMLARRNRLDRGEVLVPARDIMGNQIPDLPERWGIDIIKAGVVCDGMSTRNRFRRANDVKNTLMAAFLAFIDYYRPKYVLIENVRTIMTHPLGSDEIPFATNDKKFKLVDGIEGGILKFTVRILTSLGYQVHYTVLQVGQFGVPQSRQRWVLWAAVPGCKLPDFPQPTHCFSGRLADSMHTTKKTTPFPTVTVGEAIGDLTPFQWENPCRIIKQKRAGSGNFKEYTMTEGMEFVGRNVQPYVSGPVSEYQRMLRRHPSNGTSCQRCRRVFNHVTPAFYDKWDRITTERVCNIPIYGLPLEEDQEIHGRLSSRRSTHLNLDERLKLNGRREDGLYGRLDVKGYFHCCVGSVTPYNAPYTIHPFQNRTISVRELARAQGFPDWYIFKWGKGDTRLQDIITMIGNAVPAINFGLLLARELVKVEIDRYHESKGQPVVIELD
ncbi:C-5 cytosine-specific DNA methylase [Phlyctema vagabunda]|uniref:DNA (cytosine-5-)-methyltransferase n=1 Tax=Phlyctema vagabunda TaxID=108571 RepID=A0ABR4PER3_9HELO